MESDSPTEHGSIEPLGIDISSGAMTNKSREIWLFSFSGAQVFSEVATNPLGKGRRKSKIT